MMAILRCFGGMASSGQGISVKAYLDIVRKRALFSGVEAIAYCFEWKQMLECKYACNCESSE